MILFYQIFNECQAFSDVSRRLQQIDFQGITRVSQLTQWGEFNKLSQNCINILLGFFSDFFLNFVNFFIR